MPARGSHTVVRPPYLDKTASRGRTREESPGLEAPGRGWMSGPPGSSLREIAAASLRGLRRWWLLRRVDRVRGELHRARLTVVACRLLPPEGRLEAHETVWIKKWELRELLARVAEVRR